MGFLSLRVNYKEASKLHDHASYEYIDSRIEHQDYTFSIILAINKVLSQENTLPVIIHRL
jgi:hypothetical protein